MKARFLVTSLFIVLNFTACATKDIQSKSSIYTNDETISKEIFNKNEDWQPVNKDMDLQSSINNKEVK